MTEFLTYLILAKGVNCWGTFEHHNRIVHRMAKGVPLGYVRDLT